MLFKKLFQVLVVGGTMVGGVAGCAANAQATSPKASTDAGAAASKPADAGTKPAEPASAPPGW